MSQILNKFQNSRSLRLQIGILYSFLALVNILFFSVMIFENQTELLVKNFKFQSENFVNAVLKDLQSEKIPKNDEAILKKLNERLKLQEIFQFKIFDINGVVWYNENGIVNGDIIEEDIKKKAKEISDTSSVFASKYKLELPDCNSICLGAYFPYPIWSLYQPSYFYSCKRFKRCH